MFWCINCESVIKDNNICNKCNSNNLVKINNVKITIGELLILKSISKDVSFIEAMIKLYNEDPIEYQLKMSQFKMQVGQQTQEDNKPKCPKCNSTSITTGARGVNFTFGLLGASKTVNRCANCGHTWKP